MLLSKELRLKEIRKLSSQSQVDIRPPKLVYAKLSQGVRNAVVMAIAKDSGLDTNILSHRALVDK